MGIGNRLKLAKMVTKGFICSVFEPKYKRNETAPIDFVVTWVDGNDPDWRKEREEVLGNPSECVNGNGVGRYRDWESFRYWFRAVEQFAPWVRYVHLVTWGHVPQWLNRECPKLRIVRHSDFIPKQYLPTFNCNSIELNLFRIPELSECFVYFNDDMLLSRPVSPEEFFVGEKPRHSAVAIPYINRDNELPYHLFFNTYGIINRKNRIAECIEKNPEKWFTYLYKSSIKYNVYAWQCDGIPSIHFTHMGEPFCRSTMEKTWEKYRKDCECTCSYKLRDIHQITHQLFSIEDILNGYFVPSKNDWGQYLKIDDSKGIASAYRNQKTKMICLFDRDNLTAEEIDLINADLVKVFDQYLPEKSAFEI